MNLVQHRSKINILEVLYLILTVIVFELLDKSTLFIGQIVFCISLLSNIQLLYKYRKVDIFFIFLGFSFIHIFYIFVYYFFDIPYHYILKYQTLYNTNKIIFIQFIVLRLIFNGVSSKNYIIPRLNLLPIKNKYAFWIFLFILIILIPISNSGLSTISSDYSIETKSSIWFEYSVIFIIIASLYANTKIKTHTLKTIGFIFMCMPLLYGKRLAFLMVGLTLFNLYYSGKIKTKYLLFLFIGGFLVLRSFAVIRSNGLAGLSVQSVIFSVNNSGTLSNGPGGVLVSSVTYFGLIKEGIFNLVFSLKSFIGMFLSILIPSSLNIPETYVNTQALKYENIPGNGGFPGIYFYLWGRYIGVFIGSLLLNFFIKKSQYSTKYAIYGVFLLSTFPRWYTYNMHILIKMGAWLFILLIISKIYIKTTR
jgi:hypothetical protein